MNALPSISIIPPAVGDWADRITAAWRSSFDGILEVGQLLIEAKAALPHGSFEAMVERELPFGARTARRFMSIADDDRIANRTHVSVLPLSWGTLYELTKLDDAQFSAALDGGIIRPDMQREDVLALRRPETHVRGTFGTGENEWYTPAEYLNAARDVLGGIDLDPASDARAQAVVGAGRFFTKADDGLAQDWAGLVWLNPPYAQPAIAEFVAKMASEWRSGRMSAAIMLTHNYTDTAWFHEAAGACSAICFTRGRVKFYGPGGEVAAPTQGQAFFYFGSEVVRFAERFGGIGFVVKPAADDVTA